MGEGEGGEGIEGFDEHDWERAKNLSDDEKKQLEREIDQAIRQGIIAEQKGVGRGGGGMGRELAELLEPKVRWQDKLREYLSSLADGKDVSTWQKVNRRWLQHDMYMPSTVSESQFVS